MITAKTLLLVAAPVAGVLAWLVRSRWSSSGRARVAVIASLGVVAVAAFWGQSASHLEHLGGRGQLGAWGVYHYYLGAKYFDELGYTGLYEQTLAADAEGSRRLARVPRLRNLETYQKEDIEDPGAFRRSDAFTDERWREFRADVDYLLGCREPGFWNKVLIDRGYNASPAWQAVGGTLFRLLSIREPWSQTALVLLDVALVLLAFAFSVRAYGWARSLLVLSAIGLWRGNSEHLFGQLWILDWLAACWGALSAWRMGRDRTAGALLAYAAMVRLFPAALFLGPILHAGAGLIRRRRLETRYRRLLLAAIVCAAALFALGGVNTKHGFGAWTMFASEIANHSAHHIEGERRLGLGQLFTIDFSEGFAQELTKADNLENARRNEPVFRVAQLAMLVLLLLAIRRADAHDSLPLGAALVFIAVISSRYYGSVFVFLLLLGCGPRESSGAARAPRFGILDAALFAAFWVVQLSERAGAGRYIQYLIANALLLAWLCALLAARAFPGRKPAPVDGSSTRVAM